MKKRSLIASIAMLLVSAIVLSTSTYAWFSAGAAVSVEKITASVSNTDGSIQISATGAENTWGQDLKATTIEALFEDNSATAFVKPSVLAPITVKPGAAYTVSGSAVPGVYTNSGEGNSFTLIKGTFSSEIWDHDGSDTTPSIAVSKLVTATGATGYMTYQFKIKANADCSVTLTPTFATSKNFLMGAVSVQGKTYVYSAGSSISYAPVKVSQTVRDYNRDDIISASDDISGTNDATNALHPTVTTLGATSNITVDFDSAGAVEGNGGMETITVYIWAEGQQADCSGACETSNASFSFAAVKAS